jgi:molecular chaperone IbpA
MTRTITFNRASLGGPWAIGFDTLANRLNETQFTNDTGNYPPYNIIKHNAEEWSIEVAVAGFKRSELDVELAEGVLTVAANSTPSDAEPEYIHRGLAKRAFTRKWTLAEDVVVNDASLIDGVLAIHLQRIIPEEKKPRKIDIL